MAFKELTDQDIKRILRKSMDGAIRKEVSIKDDGGDRIVFDMGARTTAIRLHNSASRGSSFIETHVKTASLMRAMDKLQRACSCPV